MQRGYSQATPAQLAALQELDMIWSNREVPGGNDLLVKKESGFQSRFEPG